MPVRRLLYYGVQEHAPAQYGWCCHGQRRKDNPIDLALGVFFGWVAHWGPAKRQNNRQQNMQVWVQTCSHIISGVAW